MNIKQKLIDFKQTWKEKPLDWKLWLIGMFVGIPPWGSIVGIEALKIPLLVFQASGVIISITGLVLQHKRHKREREEMIRQIDKEWENRRSELLNKMYNGAVGDEKV